MRKMEVHLSREHRLLEREALREDDVLYMHNALRAIRAPHEDVPLARLLVAHSAQRLGREPQVQLECLGIELEPVREL